jgi:50S ribosomal subunit-associated GTPase HflX
VDELLAELKLEGIPRLLVLNKVDRVAPADAERLAEELGALPCCARDPASVVPVAREIAQRLASVGAAVPERSVPEVSEVPEDA